MFAIVRLTALKTHQNSNRILINWPNRLPRCEGNDIQGVGATNPGVCSSPVWDPHGIVVQEELEMVQNHAARFVPGNYNFETGSMTSIFEQLGWESLHKGHKSSKLILLFKGLKGRASIICDDLQFPNRRSRNQHSMAFQVPYARTYIYMYSFLLDTIRDRNALPASIIFSAESSSSSSSSVIASLNTYSCNVLESAHTPWIKEGIYSS